MERDIVKPPVKFLAFEDKFTKVYFYKCANCGEVYTSFIHNYCPECGQRFK